MSSSFWFRPSRPASIRYVRLGLAVITVCYFLSAWRDVSQWYVEGAPASSLHIGEFFREADLTTDARWMLSPLFLWDSALAGTSAAESAWVYKGYLLIGSLLACLVGLSALTRVASKLPKLLSGSLPSVLLWVWFVGWANRVVLLAGIVEPVLSLSLAALAVAPLDSKSPSWRFEFSRRLISLQATTVMVFTTATMLAGNVWWNGTGAYAMIAPAEDRWMDVRGSFFESPLVFELTNFFVLFALPVGLALAWMRSKNRLGVVVIACWSLIVAVLSMHILYAMTIAVIATTLGNDDISPESIDPKLPTS